MLNLLKLIRSPTPQVPPRPPRPPALPPPSCSELGSLPSLGHGSPQDLPDSPSSSPVSLSHLSLLPAHPSLLLTPVSPPSSPVSLQLTCLSSQLTCVSLGHLPHPTQGVLSSLPATSTHINSPEGPSRAWRGLSPCPPTNLRAQPDKQQGGPSPPPSLFSWTDPLPESPVSVLPPAPISCPPEKGFRGRAPHLTVDLGSRKGSQSPPSSPSSPGVLPAYGCRAPLGLAAPWLGQGRALLRFLMGLEG